jgi:ketosteroid isomerase-like protein
MSADEAAIRDVLERWARVTRDGRVNEIHTNHLDELVLFDGLVPLPYTSAAPYRDSWESWPPRAA